MRYSSYAAVSALATIATAQTFTDCNPMEKTCPNNPAMPKTWDTDFTTGKDAIKGWKQTAGSLTYGAEGAEFIINKKGDAPTIGSSAFLHYGRVEVTMKAAPGQGIVSSIVLQSDNLDEIDWEWIGGVDSRTQLNYFGKGNTSTYDRMIEADAANNQQEFHTYALDWTAEALTWIIDDKPMRTLKKEDANGGKNYPQTPCNVRLGNWPAGDSKDEGTRQWAGGNVTYDQAPFKMTVKSIKIINYSPGTEYKWTDKTGDSDSIEVIGAGNVAGASQNTIVIEPSATASLAPLESGIDAPSATGKPGSEGETGSKPTGKQSAGFDYPVGGAPKTSGSPAADETPCECGTATVTVTGAPPPATSAPAATFTTAYPAVSQSSIVTLISSVQVPDATSKGPVQPPPFPTTGLAIDTRSAPPFATPAPTGVLPVPSVPSSAPPAGGNGTVPAAPEFTGAASRHSVGVFVGAVAGAVLLAF